MYEDFTRKIAGPEAYLIFVFDRLISQVSNTFYTFLDLETLARFVEPNLGGVSRMHQHVQVEPD